MPTPSTDNPLDSSVAPSARASVQLPLDVMPRTRALPAERKGGRGSVSWTLFAIAIAVAGVGIGRRFSTAKTSEVVSPAVSAQTDRVVALGKLLPISGVRTVASPFGAGDARIAVLKVDEGDRVEAGTTLAVFDNEGALRAAVESARAQLGARGAARAQVESSVVVSRAELKAQLERARVVVANASRELDRTRTLHQSGAATAQAVDIQKTAFDEALHEVDRLQASQSRYGFGRVASQADTVLAARNVDAAKADVIRATADLEKAYVRAPIAGTVLTIHTQPGERPGNKGILKLGDLSLMKVAAEVYQTHIGRITLGSRVKVRAAALPKELLGVVSKIGLEVGRQETMDPNPAANTDARVVKVTVTLDEASSLLARGLTNLQVTTEFAASGVDK